MYALLFVVAMTFAAVVFIPGNEGLFVLFSFVAPGLGVWWYERRRAKRRAEKTDVSAASAVESNFRRSATPPAKGMPSTKASSPSAQAIKIQPTGPTGQSAKWQELDLSAVVQKNRASIEQQAKIPAQSFNPSLASTVPPQVVAHASSAQGKSTSRGSVAQIL